VFSYLCPKTQLASLFSTPNSNTSSPLLFIASHFDPLWGKNILNCGVACLSKSQQVYTAQFVVVPNIFRFHTQLLECLWPIKFRHCQRKTDNGHFCEDYEHVAMLGVLMSVSTLVPLIFWEMFSQGQNVDNFFWF